MSPRTFVGEPGVVSLEGPALSSAACGAMPPRFLEILAGGADRGAAPALLDAMIVGLGARYVAFFQKERSGWRPVFERRAAAGAAAEVPAALTRGAADGVRAVRDAQTLWVAFSRGEAVLVGALAAADEEGARRFLRLSPGAATFLARCRAGRDENTGSLAILAALSSLVHDTLNLMTGLSLCLAAYVQNRLAGRQATPEEEALLDRSLASLEALCKEYASMDRASRVQAGTADIQATVRAYRDLFAKFDVEPERVEVRPGFALTADRQGLVLRALVHVSLAILQLGGSRVRLVAGRRSGASEVCVVFACRAGVGAEANAALLQAAELIENRGGRGGARARGRAVRVQLAFPCGAPGLRAMDA